MKDLELSLWGSHNDDHPMFGIHSFRRGNLKDGRDAVKTRPGFMAAAGVRLQLLLTLIEAPAKCDSCLMCWPCLPMMAPTASVGMNRWTVSDSGLPCCAHVLAC